MIIYKDYGIKANDVGGYILGNFKKNKEGVRVFYAISYPSTLQRALQEIIKLEFAKAIEVDLTLKEAIQTINNIYEDLQKNMGIGKEI